MANEIEVKVPDIGDFSDVEIVEVLVSEGDTVEKEAALITLESDKASIEVPSTAKGTIKKMLVKAGDRVSQGDAVCVIEAEGEAEEAPKKEEPEAKASEPAPKKEEPAKKAQPSGNEDDASSSRGADTERKSRSSEPAKKVDEAAFASAHATPSVRKLARELGADLGNIHGTGRKGRIVREDVVEYVKNIVSRPAAQHGATGSGIPAIPAVDFSKFGETETVPLSRIQKISGPVLHRSWVNIPHVTHHEEADITLLDAFRKEVDTAAKKEGYRVTLLSFLIKAVTKVLAEMPVFNSSLSPDGQSLIQKKYFNIGVAVDTPNGLVVPVIKDTDKLGIVDISKALGELSQKARDGKLGPKDIQGACFSISSLGGIGGTGFTPIVNAPEVAILGVTRSKMQPVWDGSQFVPRLMLPLSLSYDHRVIDGAAAARFQVRLAELLTDARKMLL